VLGAHMGGGHHEQEGVRGDAEALTP
jgi:hypothetical protein